jgi:hypothetical protein
MMKTFDELATPDPRSLRWVAGSNSPEQAAEQIQRTISHVTLADEVGQQTQKAFERLSLIYTYGLFCYEFFTVADDQSLLFHELAIAERFMEFYDYQIRFVRQGLDPDSPLEEE